MGVQKLETRVKRNGTYRAVAKQLSDPAYAKVNVPHVVHMMIARTSSTRSRTAAGKLLRIMAEEPWTLVGGVHTSKDDPTRHISIDVDGCAYHLRLTKTDLIFEITNATKNDAGISEEKKKRQRRILTGGLRPDQTSGPLIR